MIQSFAFAYTAIILGVVAFQVALIAGAPWGRLTQGGLYEGALPTWGRAAAGVSIFILIALGLPDCRAIIGELLPILFAKPACSQNRGGFFQGDAHFENRKHQGCIERCNMCALVVFEHDKFLRRQHEKGVPDPGSTTGMPFCQGHLLKGRARKKSAGDNVILDIR